MFWFLIFLVFVIFAPMILFITGLAIGLFAIPFIVFFGLWAAVIWLVMLTLPAFFWIGVIGGLIIALTAARGAFLAVSDKRHRGTTT